MRIRFQCGARPGQEQRCNSVDGTGSYDRLRRVSADIGTLIHSDYEYAGGKSSPIPVAVDGPGIAGGGLLAEYVAAGT